MRKLTRNLWTGLYICVVLLLTRCDGADPGPELTVRETSLDFGMVEISLTITIQNLGGRTLNWTITDDREWIDVMPTTGETMGIEPVTVTVTVDRMRVSPGSHEGTITITSNGGNATVRVLVAVPVDLGVFSETAEENLELGVNAFIGTFTDPSSSIKLARDSVDTREGIESLRTTISVDESASEFAGWFVSWGDASRVGDDDFVRDMSGYKDGGLIFWVKSPINLEVGIRSGNVLPGTETSKVLLSDFPSFVPNNVWHRVCLPLSVFEGIPPMADLSQMKVFFIISSNVVSGGTGGVEQTFHIDDIQWIPRGCP